MSVRKRRWTTAKGEAKEAWICDYFDQHGQRHIETFPRKKDADDWAAEIKGEVNRGVHTARSTAITVAAAGKAWLESCEARGLERASIEMYESHIRLHIVPFLGRRRLPELTAPIIRQFKDDLRLGKPAPGEQQGRKRSADMVRRVMVSLGSLLADAQEAGLVAQNIVRSQPRKRQQVDRRQRGKLQVGVDIPRTDEIRTLVAHLDGRWRPLLLVAVFCGLRASELRGLRWADVDLKKAELHVRQRADKWGIIGRPKSQAGERTLPLFPIVLNSLREAKLQSKDGLVFATSTGRALDYRAVIKHGLIPAMIKAGITDEHGKAKYTGLHSLRHFFASWCINSVDDGGRGLLAKRVQQYLGHSSITLTMDRYGHLFPESEEGRAGLAAAERALLA